MNTEARLRVTALDWITLALVVVGAVNWGLVGAGMFLEAIWNLVTLLLGSVPAAEALTSFESPGLQPPPAAA